MTVDIGVRVRTLINLKDTEGNPVPARSFGDVIGYQGEKIMVDIYDNETDTHQTVIADRWEVRR